MIKIDIDKNAKTPKQYSKVWMSRLQLFSMFWISVYFIVDIIFNKGANVNNIVVLLVTSVIGSCIPYMCKSFFETKADKQLELEKYKLSMNNGSMGINCGQYSTLSPDTYINIDNNMGLNETYSGEEVG